MARMAVSLEVIEMMKNQVSINNLALVLAVPS